MDFTPHNNKDMKGILSFKIPISGTDYEPERMELTMEQAHTIARGRAKQYKDREVRLYAFNATICRWELLTEYKYNGGTKQVDRADCWRPLKPGDKIR